MKWENSFSTIEYRSNIMMAKKLTFESISWKGLSVPGISSNIEENELFGFVSESEYLLRFREGVIIESFLALKQEGCLKKLCLWGGIFLKYLRGCVIMYIV